jgi:hypothetical protein
MSEFDDDDISVPYAPNSAWEQISDGIGTEEEPYWWHVDNHNAISHDGGLTYYMIDEPLEGNGAPRIYSTLLRPVVHRDVPKNLREAVQIAVGAASSCWENLRGAGVFDSERALQVSEDLLTWINEHYEQKENISA